jgi:hypothetical protein
VPVNTFDYQYAHNGNGYAGFLTYCDYCLDSNTREYLQTPLINHLLPGSTYFIEFFISFANYPRFASNNIGAYFSKNGLGSNNQSYFPVVPQFNYTDIITDRDNWIRVCGDFIATDTFNYLTIGNFFNNANTDTVLVNVTQWQTDSYYLIDDVFVSQIGRSSFTPMLTTNKQKICAGDSAQLCVSPGFFDYFWNTGQSDSCILISLAGNYYVTAIDSNGCPAESNQITITANPLPAVSVSVSGNSISVYNSVSQQWFLNGTPISGATADTLVVAQGGSYTVMVTDSNGCTAGSNAIVISDLDNLAWFNVSIYPNPTSSALFVSAANKQLGAITIYDLTGKKIAEQSYSTEIDVSTLSNGIYFVEIRNSAGTKRERFVKM